MTSAQGPHRAQGGGYGPPGGPGGYGPPGGGGPGGYGPPGGPGGYGPPGGGGPGGYGPPGGPGGYGPPGGPGGYGPPGGGSGGYGAPGYPAGSAPPGGYGPPGAPYPGPSGAFGAPGGPGNAELKKKAQTWLIISAVSFFVCGSCFGVIGGALCFMAMQAADQGNVSDAENKLKWGKIISVVGFVVQTVLSIVVGALYIAQFIAAQ